ncbi:MAG: glycosyltransferase family 2 protein [Candidatus Diapherotrites archaeon]|nr:glycosyltransferase family 2 protein [Candidatus Diapherotrites archaeon]
MKLVITIPAFNEEKTLPKVLSELPQKIQGIDEIQIVIVDDGSMDATSEIALKNNTVLVRHTQNMGLAQTFKRALNEALLLNADIIVNIDADAQYDGAEIQKLIQPILEKKADIVLGSRFLGKIEYMPFGNRFGNQIATAVVRWLTGLKITDSQTGFRVFSREAAARMNILSKYTYTQETLLQAAEYRLAVVEVPVTFRKRSGKSRLISSLWNYTRNAGLTVLMGYINYRPLRFFLSLGALSILISSVLGLRVLLHYLNTGLVSPFLPSAFLAGVLLVVGLQLLFIGLIAEMVKFSRKTSEDVLYQLKKNKFNE